MADAKKKKLTSGICGRTDDLNVEQADDADHTGTVGIRNPSVFCLSKDVEHSLRKRDRCKT